VTWLADNRHWLLFAGLVVTTLAALGSAVVGTIATVGALLTGGGLLAPLALLVFGPLVAGGLALGCGVALARELARSVSIPRDERLASAAGRLERLVPPLSALGLVDRFEPTVEDRREALRKRYVEGDLSEAEFEARLDDLLEGDRERDDAVDRSSAGTATIGADHRERDPE